MFALSEQINVHPITNYIPPCAESNYVLFGLLGSSGVQEFRSSVLLSPEGVALWGCHEGVGGSGGVIPTGLGLGDDVRLRNSHLHKEICDIKKG